MRYETERLILEPIVSLPTKTFVDIETGQSIYETWRGWFHDPEIIKWTSHGTWPMTDKDMEALIHEIEEHRVIAWRILVKTDGKREAPYHGYYGKDTIYAKHIGNISLQSFDWIARTCEHAAFFRHMNHARIFFRSP